MCTNQHSSGLGVDRPLQGLSRSTWVKDKSPRERPDVRPANDTRTKHMNRYSQNLGSQHGALSSLIVLFSLQNV